MIFFFHMYEGLMKLITAFMLEEKITLTRMAVKV